MRVRLLSLVLAAVAAVSITPGTASAAVFEPRGAASATNGIAYGADGNVWVAEEFNDSVARF
ncbi:MAG: hypothetical protein REI11_21605, partial [Patulibacter sp.]|nr:hypothetical protein [Patulibacter sp.]